MAGHRVPLTDCGMRAMFPVLGDIAIHVLVDLDGPFSASELTEALDGTMGDYPVLACRYVDGFYRDRYIPDEAPVAELVHVVDPVVDLEGATARWIREHPIDFLGRPIRLVQLVHKGGARLICTVLHRVADGAGVMAVAVSLGAHLTGTRPFVPIEEDRSLSLTIERFRFYHLPLMIPYVIAEAFRPLSVRRIPLRQAASDDPDAPFHWRDLVLDTERFGEFRAWCKERGATVNDGLVAAVARVAASQSTEGPVAVAYSIDLRRFMSSPRLTMANLSSILFVPMERAALREADTAVATANRKTRAQLRGVAGPSLLFFLNLLVFWAPHAFVRRIAPWMAEVFMLPLANRATFLTNVGRMDQGLAAFGDRVQGVRLVGPCVLGATTPFVTAYGHRGKLHLHMYGAPGVVESQLHQFAETLDEMMQTGTAP